MQDTYLPSGVAVFIVAAVFTALPTSAVALRIAGRRIKRSPLGYDDFLIIASLVRLYFDKKRKTPPFPPKDAPS